MKRTAIGFFILCFFAPSLASAQLTHNFIGLSPASIEEENLLRDRAVEKTVNLQRDLSDQPVTLEVTFDGPDGRFLQGPETVEFEVGQLRTTYTFEILPEGAATGSYSALVNFLPTVAEASGGSGFGIRRGVTLKVDFTVSDTEVVDFDILRSELRQTEVGLPLFFQFSVDNTGNVEWRPDRIVLAFENSDTGEQAPNIEILGSDLAFAQPSNISEIQIDVEHDLGIGTYDVDIMFYMGDDVVHASTSSLIVFTPGTLEQSAELVALSTNKQVYNAGEKIKLTGVLRNSGDIPTVGTMITEVYSADGELVDILISDARTVSPGEEAGLDQFITLNEPSAYSIRSYIEYAGTKTTETAEVEIEVQATLISNSLTLLPFILLVAATVLFIVVLIVGIAKRGKKKRSATPATPAVEVPVVKKEPTTITATAPEPKKPAPSGQEPGLPAKASVQAPPVEASERQVAKPEVPAPPKKPKNVSVPKPPPKSVQSAPTEVQSQGIGNQSPQPTSPSESEPAPEKDDDMWTISL